MKHKLAERNNTYFGQQKQKQLFSCFCFFPVTVYNINNTLNLMFVLHTTLYAKGTTQKLLYVQFSTLCCGFRQDISRNILEDAPGCRSMKQDIYQLS